MPEPASKAVFLSYASQDTDAARRICEALRSRGIEVWLDQSELRGGDSWDQKIRRQIKECALFVPIISANTEGRLEGYFRLEWRLADQRTHHMARGKPFLVPVVVDHTRDDSAHVPDSFLEVQWTRLPAGDTPPAFCERVARLLQEDGAAAASEPQVQRAAPAVAPRPSRAWLVPAIVVILAVLAVAIWRPWLGASKALPAAVPPAASAPLPAELAQVRARIQPDRWKLGDFEAVSSMLDRLIQARPDDADAWALRSIINSLQVLRNFDSGTKPLEDGGAAAQRALSLAPASALAELAQGMHLTAMISRGGDPLAARAHIDRGVAGLPRDSLTRYGELTSYWLGYQFDGTERSAMEWLKQEPHASFPAWILAQMFLGARRPAEAIKWANEAAADEGITGLRARITLFEVEFYLRADLPASRAALNLIPAGARAGNHRAIFALWLVDLAEGNADQALQELAQAPEAMFSDRIYHGPKALLAGLAHQAAGRPEVALVQFREAERLLREELAKDTDNQELHAVLAYTLACSGRSAEARAELASIEPLMRGRAPSIYSDPIVLLIAQTYGVLGEAGEMAAWLRTLLSKSSMPGLTPASLRVDPRFAKVIDMPQMQALLTEFAGLDQAGTANATAPDGKSVAVLAFENLSDDKENEYFSDGISEELLTVLQKIPGLRVAARTSSFYFKGKNATAQEIGEKLGVANLVEGSVRRAGNNVRISARLSRAATGEQLWSESYTRDLKDVFAVQTELAQTIVEQLRRQLGGPVAKEEIQAQVQAAEKGGTKNVEAHQLYLQGMYFLNQYTIESFNRASDLLGRAVELDPEYALAWSALSQVGGLVNGYASTKRETEAGRALALRAAESALALQPDLAAAHLAMATVHVDDFDWKGAGESVRRAKEISPADSEVLKEEAELAYAFGRAERTIELARQAAALDPVNTEIRIFLAFSLSATGRFNEADAEFRRLTDLSPASPWSRGGLALNYLCQGKFNDAAREAERTSVEWARLYLLAEVRWAQDKRSESDAALAHLIDTFQDVAAYQVAEAYAYRRENDRAFEWLDRAFRQRDPGLVWTRLDFALGNLHSDPRWPVFLSKLGLSDEQLK